MKKTEMDFPHEGKTLTAVYPFYGPENSKNVQDFIRKDSYTEPTSAELISFVHKYFNGNEPQAQEVQKIMRRDYFNGFTGILYVPEEEGKGLAHFIDYPQFAVNSIIDRDNLLKRLDESRAQVSFEHIRECAVPWQEVAKHPYFIAWAGSKEGAEKLAELASKHPIREAYIWSSDVSNLKEPTARVATLDSSWGDDRLDIGSEHYGNYEGGYAFGKLKDTK